MHCCKDQGLVSPGLFLGHGSDARTMHRFGHPLPFSAQTGGGKIKVMASKAPAQHWNIGQPLSWQLPSLPRTEGKLTGEEGLSHSPLPPFQCTENPISPPQSLAIHSRHFICSHQAANMHMAVPCHGRNGVLEMLWYKDIFVLKLLTNLL